VDLAALLAELRRDAVGEVRDDPATRELYAADASLYRRLPVAALRAAEAADLDAALSAARASGTPVTFRGGGTSLAGQAVGRGLVVDCSSLRAAEVDPDARRARVEPGVVLADLNAAAAEHGLTFGPDVATASRATLGGMIANNSAGARSIVYGLTADHVEALEVTLADGTRATLRRGQPAPPALEALRPLAAAVDPPRLLRRVSGYNLDALAGDDPDWPRLACGSEGTLMAVRAAELRLVPLPNARGLALVPFRSVGAALEAVPDLLEAGPSAVELLDRSLLDPENRPPAVARMLGAAIQAPAALLVEHSGDAEEVAARLAALGGRHITDPGEQAAMWEVRRSGLARAMSATAGLPGDPRPIPFIEDPAVPPERLPELMRRLEAILAGEGVPAVIFGHASVGCMHVRPLMDLRVPGAVAAMRRIAEATADLVVECGGSLSGEHGDGRARGELLPRMYPQQAMDAFRELKRRLDPEGLLNPGVLIDADPLDSGLRLVASPPRRQARTTIGFAREGGLARAGEACNGNGACRASASAGAMCPSYQALVDERHSTRGRAVLLRAAIEGRLAAGLADDGLHEALELCLGCKSCAAECPAQVDVTRLRSEALAHRFRAHGVPLAARAMGATPTALRAGSRVPGLARLGARAASRFVGRRLPAPTATWRPPAPGSDGTPITLLVDTFTKTLHPEVGDAAVAVLSAAGARVEVLDAGCCGRPLLSAGLVEAARRRVRRMLSRVAARAVEGRPLVMLEPSCWSMLRDDLLELLPRDPRARWVSEAAVTFEQALEGLELPPLRPRAGTAIVHRHCHARALGAGDAIERAARMVPGLEVRDSGAGCCGMAGAFGYRHPELSRAIAEDRLLPAARDADLVVAHGTSCRHQVAELAKRPAVHPAELLAQALP